MGREDNGHEQDRQGGVKRRVGALPPFVPSPTSSFRPPNKKRISDPDLVRMRFRPFSPTPPSPRRPHACSRCPDPTLTESARKPCATLDRIPSPGASTAGRIPSPATGAVNYEFDEVTTRAGNGRSHEWGGAARRGRQFEILTGLFRDLEGILMP